MLNATEPFSELPELALTRNLMFKARELLLRINTLRAQLLDPSQPGPSADEREAWEEESIGTQMDVQACIRAAEIMYDDW